MAKPIPVKKPSRRKVEIYAEYVDLIMAAQDVSVCDAVDAMVDSLWAMSDPRMTLNDQEKEDMEILFKWVAVRCLVACAEWDIKIANFRGLSNKCIRCGKKVK